MLTEAIYSKDDVARLIQQDINKRFGTQFVLDSIIVMDEDNEQALQRFEVHGQIIIKEK